MTSDFRIPAAEQERHFGRYQEIALRQPITVTSNGRDRCVLLSCEEYRRLKRRDRKVLRAEDFTEEDGAAIETAEPPAETAAFDHELPSPSIPNRR